MIGQIKVREFRRVDNVEYSSWFSDPSMHKTMGPAWNDEELDHIFSEEKASVLSAFHSSELVGVVSLAFPDDEISSYGITGIAVKPQRQRQGYGAKIILAAQNYCNTQKARSG